MKILVDMNLSPEWIPTLIAGGFEAAHWSSIGNPKAQDVEILEWARRNDWIVFTNDLDLEAGALIVVDESSLRVRILPIR
jgi:predicted nuclease of predicted toxin-antitoxin system